MGLKNNRFKIECHRSAKDRWDWKVYRLTPDMGWHEIMHGSRPSQDGALDDARSSMKYYVQQIRWREEAYLEEYDENLELTKVVDPNETSEPEVSPPVEIATSVKS